LKCHTGLVRGVALKLLKDAHRVIGSFQRHENVIVIGRSDHIAAYSDGA
jgi:hypothetical protein